RYRSPELHCRLVARTGEKETGPGGQGLDEMFAPGTVEVTLLTPYKAVTPGQVAVFYEGELVLGAGFIR
ncbi:MAG: hypothetical protein QHH43_10630, partial [Candidatus Saccharicenans sp.]|nr:hypothetical protein [Candidatus Saccharicenans sp.]